MTQGSWKRYVHFTQAQRQVMACTWHHLKKFLSWNLGKIFQIFANCEFAVENVKNFKFISQRSIKSTREMRATSRINNPKQQNANTSTCNVLTCTVPVVYERAWFIEHTRKIATNETVFRINRYYVKCKRRRFLFKKEATTILREIDVILISHPHKRTNYC